MLIDYLPDFYRKIRDISGLLEAEDTTFEKLFQSVELIESCLSISTMPENEIELIERRIGIPPGAGGAVDIRRLRIASRFMASRFFDFDLVSRLAKIYGLTLSSISQSDGVVSVGVFSDGESSKRLSDFKEALDLFLPCHLSLTISPALVSHRMLARLSHGALAEYSHIELSENFEYFGVTAETY